MEWYSHIVQSLLTYEESELRYLQQSKKRRMKKESKKHQNGLSVSFINLNSIL